MKFHLWAHRKRLPGDFYCTFHFHKPGSTGQFISAMHMIFLRKEWTRFFCEIYETLAGFRKPSGYNLRLLVQWRKEKICCKFFLANFTWFMDPMAFFLLFLGDWVTLGNLRDAFNAINFFFLHAISKSNVNSFLTDDNRIKNDRFETCAFNSMIWVVKA